MFVINCDVNKTEILKFPKEAPLSKKQQKKNKRKQKKMKLLKMDEDGTDLVDAGTSIMGSKSAICDLVEQIDMDTFHPVKCSICTTEVGVYDHDEVYHFFNVLVSHA